MAYPKGTKVTPIGKSVGWNLGTSIEWKNARALGHNYLYVISYTHVTNLKCACYLLSYDPDKVNGDYYLDRDIVPYCELSPDAFYLGIGLSE